MTNTKTCWTIDRGNYLQADGHSRLNCSNGRNFVEVNDTIDGFTCVATGGAGFRRIFVNGGADSGWTAIHICVKKYPNRANWTIGWNIRTTIFENTKKLQQGLKNVQEGLPSKRRELAEEGYPAFEEIEELQFGTFFGMNLEWGRKVEEAKRKQKQMERKLSVAQTRLEVAQLQELGEKVERDR